MSTKKTVDSQGTQVQTEPRTTSLRDHHTDPTLKGRTFQTAWNLRVLLLSCASEQTVFIIYGSSFCYFDTENITYGLY